MRKMAQANLRGCERATIKSATGIAYRKANEWSTHETPRIICRLSRYQPGGGQTRPKRIRSKKERRNGKNSRAASLLHQVVAFKLGCGVRAGVEWWPAADPPIKAARHRPRQHQSLCSTLATVIMKVFVVLSALAAVALAKPQLVSPLAYNGFYNPLGYSYGYAAPALQAYSAPAVAYRRRRPRW
ncbi:Hypothetical predicted protein [Cloeon dipterum]|uniref:Uncharacterized protein n=1 Tax=Cloeon dipterum TaxID=197152 RepID=A0A8S1E348_9INSE|nr:Hypothetical predicted protein [Cloeon dipterum]